MEYMHSLCEPGMCLSHPWPQPRLLRSLLLLKVLLDVGIISYSKSSESSLTPHLRCSHVISFPGRISMSAELGHGWGGGSSPTKNDTDSHCFYPAFHLWNINASQMVSDKFPECWKCCFVTFAHLCSCFLKKRVSNLFPLLWPCISTWLWIFWWDQLFLGWGVCGELEFPPLRTQELHPNPLWICLWVLHVWHHAWCTAGAQQMFVALMIWKMADRWHDPFKHWMWTRADLALGLKYSAFSYWSLVSHLKKNV